MTTSKAALFMIDGFEETEALTTVDILRRGQVDVTTISLGSGKMLTGGHNMRVEADEMFGDMILQDFDMLLIPGGTIAYMEHEGLMKMLRKYADEGKKLGAICAAPAVFGQLGILHEKRAVCYPGMEKWLAGASIAQDIVVTDGNITTSKGPGTTVYFALRVLEILRGKDVADEVAQRFLVQKPLGVSDKEYIAETPLRLAK